MALLHESPWVTTAGEIADILGMALPAGCDPMLRVAGISTDTRTIGAGNCFLALKGESFNGNLYAKKAAETGAVLCILSEMPPDAPDVPCLLVPDALAAYTALANAYLLEKKAAGLRVIAVTGSSGKTTVKDMTAHLLGKTFRTYATAGNHNNHIGVPYTILHMPQSTEIAVLEMGMNHAGELTKLSRTGCPDIALVTNIGTAHIGNLGSQENIFRAKMEITAGMPQGEGRLILPAEDAFLAKTEAIPLDRSALHYVSRTGLEIAELQAYDITENAESTKFSVSCHGETAEVLLPMTGLHNVTDALLAMQAGLLCGMTLAECAAALADFVTGALRSERVTLGHCTVIRDYYNANPEAMAAALQALDTMANGAKKIAILGNMNELGDFAADRHRTLGELCKTTVDAAFFCGVNAPDFAQGYGRQTAFTEQADLISALLPQVALLTAEPCFILIKGSRGVHMENVYDALAAVLGAGDAE